MDEQEKELEEILRMFDKAPSPSSENSVQNQAQQNNKQLRQIPQRQSCSQQTVHSSKQCSTKKPENRQSRSDLHVIKAEGFRSEILPLLLICFFHCKGSAVLTDKCQRVARDCIGKSAVGG